MFRRVLFSLVACTALVVGCHKRGEGDEANLPRPANMRTIVSVDNRAFLDMTIYVLDGTQRVRLGTANGSTVTHLTIPPHLVRGGAPLRFICDPIGSDRTPISDEIVVEPGDNVSLFIPAN